MSIDNTLLNKKVLLLAEEVKAWEYIAKQLIEIIPFMPCTRDSLERIIGILDHSLGNAVKSSKQAKEVADMLELAPSIHREITEPEDKK